MAHSQYPHCEVCPNPSSLQDMPKRETHGKFLPTVYYFPKMPATFMAVPLFKQSLILLISSSGESCLFQSPGQVQPSWWMEPLLTTSITPCTLHSLPCPIIPFCYSRIPLCSKYLLCLSIPLAWDVPKARAMSCSSFCTGCLFPKYMCFSWAHF